MIYLVLKVIKIKVIFGNWYQYFGTVVTLERDDEYTELHNITRIAQTTLMEDIMDFVYKSKAMQPPFHFMSKTTYNV